MSDFIDHSFFLFNMAWLPFERYTITSPLTSAQIEQKLRSVDENAAGYSAAFKGDQIIIKEPLVIKLGAYTNSFRPEAVIVVTETPQGTMLKVGLRPPIKAIVFLCLMLCFLLAGVIFSKRAAIAVGDYKAVLIAVIGTLTMSYLLPVVAFNAELEKIKLFINHLFQVHQNK